MTKTVADKTIVTAGTIAEHIEEIRRLESTPTPPQGESATHRERLHTLDYELGDIAREVQNAYDSAVDLRYRIHVSGGDYGNHIRPDLVKNIAVIEAARQGLEAAGVTITDTNHNSRVDENEIVNTLNHQVSGGVRQDSGLRDL